MCRSYVCGKGGREQPNGQVHDVGRAKATLPGGVNRTKRGTLNDQTSISRFDSSTLLVFRLYVQEFGVAQIKLNQIKARQHTTKRKD